MAKLTRKQRKREEVAAFIDKRIAKGTQTAKHLRATNRRIDKRKGMSKAN